MYFFKYYSNLIKYVHFYSFFDLTYYTFRCRYYIYL